MILKCLKTLIYLATLCCGIIANALADASKNPCGGDNALLSIVNRPTVANSPCVVPFKKFVLEAGFQEQDLRSGGDQQNFPDSELRIGLPTHSEISVRPSNYIHQSISPHSGSTPTLLGLKHEIGYAKNWVAAVETLFTLPSGSVDFGSEGLGGALNGIMSYDVNEHLELTFQFGVSSETAPRNLGGKRFTSFNPDFVLVVPIQEKFHLYGEVYGQTKTNPDEETGFNMDAGMQYLLLKNLAVDVEFGQHMTGTLEDFEHYLGTGLAVMF